jgi:hypothetical protein
MALSKLFINNKLRHQLRRPAPGFAAAHPDEKKY